MFRCVTRPLVAAALAVGMTGCFNMVEPVSEIYGSTMGSTYSIKWVGVSGSPEPIQLQAGIEELFSAYDRELSTWRSDSDLSRFNDAPVGSCLDMPRSVLDLVSISDQLSRDSNGAFDLTVGPLMKLWGFHGEHQRVVPDEQQLAETLLRVGQQHLRIEGEQLCKDADVQVDVSAIAAGYIIDRVVEHLATFGITSYMVEITGELKAAGLKPGNRPWRIAIEEPRDDDRVAHLTLDLDGYGVSTSGDYRNYFEFEGKRYSHTFDPHTGKPVMHTLAAVTVLTPTATEADGLSTVLLVKGPEEGWEYAVEREIAALFVIRDGEGFTSRSTPQFIALQQGEE